jgi:hypothetical protein
MTLLDFSFSLSLSLSFSLSTFLFLFLDSAFSLTANLFDFQANVIPLALKGKDILAKAKTGDTIHRPFLSFLFDLTSSSS